MARRAGTSISQPREGPHALVPVFPVDLDARPLSLLHPYLLRSHRVRRHLSMLHILTPSLLGIYDPNSLMTHSCTPCSPINHSSRKSKQPSPILSSQRSFAPHRHSF